MSGWYRMYDDELDDPRIQRLPAEDFKFRMNCLHLANRHGGFLPSIEDIAFAFRMTDIAVRSTLDRLLIAGLIEVSKGGPNGKRIAPLDWNKRQYKSDTSTERVQRFRERQATATETPLRARSESDQNQNLKSTADAVVVDLFGGQQQPEPVQAAIEPDQSYTPTKEFWDLGPAVLKAVGVEQKSIRGLMGKLQKARRPDECCRIIELMSEQPPADPVPWLMSWCNPARRVPFANGRPPPDPGDDGSPFGSGEVMDSW